MPYADDDGPLDLKGTANESRVMLGDNLGSPQPNKMKSLSHGNCDTSSYLGGLWKSDCIVSIIVQ